MDGYCTKAQRCTPFVRHRPCSLPDVVNVPLPHVDECDLYSTTKIWTSLKTQITEQKTENVFGGNKNKNIEYQ